MEMDNVEAVDRGTGMSQSVRRRKKMEKEGREEVEHFEDKVELELSVRDAVK